MSVDLPALRESGELHILDLARAERIFAEAGEDEPRRGRAVVLVSGEAVRLVGEVLDCRLVRPVRRLFGMPEVGVDEGQVERRLIRDCELSEVDRRHLRHLMDLSAVAVDAVVRLESKERVELLEQLVLAAVERCQPFEIVRDREGRLPCRRLGVFAAPFQRVEAVRHFAVGIASAHEAGLGVEEVRVVLRAAFVFGDQIVPPERLCNRRDAPVAVRRVEGEVHALAVLVARDIAVFHIGFCAVPSEAGQGTVVVRVVEHAVKGVLPRPARADPVHNRRGDDRVDQRGGHASDLADGDPAGQPAAFAVVVDEALEHLGKLVPRDLREERVDRPVGVPEAVVGVARTLVHGPVVGRVVDHLPVRVEFVALMRIEEGAPEAGVEGAGELFVVEFRVDASEPLFPDRLVLREDPVVPAARDLAIDHRLRELCREIGRAEGEFDLLLRQRDVAEALLRAIRADLRFFEINVAGREFQNIVHFEVRRDVAGVPGRRADHFILFRNERIGVVAHHREERENGGTVRREAETSDGAALGRGDGEEAAGAKEADADLGGGHDVVRRTVTAPCAARRGRDDVVLGGHEKGAVVGDPRARLMGEADAFDAVGFGVVVPAPVALGLRREGGHAERTLDEGQGVALGEAGNGFGPLTDIDEGNSLHGIPPGSGFASIIQDFPPDYKGDGELRRICGGKARAGLDRWTNSRYNIGDASRATITPSRQRWAIILRRVRSPDLDRDSASVTRVPSSSSSTRTSQR